MQIDQTTAQNSGNRKYELEEKKLQLEILELEKSWFKKPTFLVPIIGALSSILVLWVTGFFNTKIESLTVKRELLNYETIKLKELKSTLIYESSKLEKTKKSLQLDTTILNKKIKFFQKENDSIRIILQKNAEISNALRNNNHALNSEIINKKRELNSISDSLKTATMPIITIVLYKMFEEGDENVGIYMSNTGTGTAYFKDINFYYNHDVFKYQEKNPLFLQKMLVPLGLSTSYMETESKITSNNIKTSGSLGPGQSYPILRVAKTKSTPDNISKFFTAIIGLEIEVIYQSSKGKAYSMRRKFTKEECEF